MNKGKQYGSNMSSDILANHLLKAANLSEYHEQWTCATISELKLKIFGDMQNILKTPCWM